MFCHDDLTISLIVLLCDDDIIDLILEKASPDSVKAFCYKQKSDCNI